MTFNSLIVIAQDWPNVNCPGFIKKNQWPPKLSGFEPAGLSRMGSYVGEIPQSATKAKNDKRIEGHIGVGMGRFTPGTHQQGNKKLYKETLNMCGNWWWTH